MGKGRDSVVHKVKKIEEASFEDLCHQSIIHLIQGELMTTDVPTTELGENGNPSVF